MGTSERRGSMINLAEELFDYIGACGYGIEDIKAVRARGLNDGVLYGVDVEAFLNEIKGLNYDEHDAKMHVSRDLRILMKDGSTFCREHAPSGFEWFKWNSGDDDLWQDRSGLIMAQPDEVEILLG